MSDETAGSEPSGAAPDLSSLLFLRWQEPPAEWLTPDRQEKRRLAKAMRSVIEQLDATDAPIEALASAADELEAIAAEFAHEPKDLEFEGYRESANAGGDPHASCESSPLIGRANPLAPPMTLVERDGVVHATVMLGAAYEGPPGCVHGGFVAALFDELLGATQSMSGAPGMTGRLVVNYRAPTPLHTELRLEGRIRGIDGRKIVTDGQLFVGDSLRAEAEGLFISIDVTRFAELKAQRDELAQQRQH
jgi:acyl-coenzyme A thioesterase PaaI-like protein